MQTRAVMQCKCNEKRAKGGRKREARAGERETRREHRSSSPTQSSHASCVTLSVYLLLLLLHLILLSRSESSVSCRDVANNRIISQNRVSYNGCISAFLP